MNKQTVIGEIKYSASLLVQKEVIIVLLLLAMFLMLAGFLG